jgi:hypothetical protein
MKRVEQSYGEDLGAKRGVMKPLDHWAKEKEKRDREKKTTTHGRKQQKRRGTRMR